MKQCSNCKQLKNNSEFYPDKRNKDELQSWCKRCQIDYYQNPIRKKSLKLARQKYRKTKKGKDQLKRESQSEKFKKRIKRYKQSEKGRKILMKRRNLKYIPLWNNLFPNEINVHFHHINNLLTIPLPAKTHLSTNGKNHRERCNLWIEKFYCIDIERLLKC